MNDDSLGDSESEAASSSEEEEDKEDRQGYEPPEVRSLGTLPESTGMPASPTSFPSDPTR